MKSCLGMLIALAILVIALGTLGGIWYLSSNVEASRADTSSPVVTE